MFSSSKIAVFLDGDFWHGNKFEEWNGKLDPYWKGKISKTIERDLTNKVILQELGWTVVRFWESQVQANLDSVVVQIQEAKERNATRVRR